ncbi:hypothetical protein Pan14r_46210 [Crateriforma conspicua]|uniref:Uncharacterized protein n=2 Tax=Crateriforma conspicua TaxID=2527996 RepID=A0A5C5YCX2_9PLAN|nr:hypothetical protein Mal65_05770 [Crateriforma conspicua]TWT72301.1 hypothetical protein Pan14r_46210 [Crateriforma conspicua]
MCRLPTSIVSFQNSFDTTLFNQAIAMSLIQKTVVALILAVCLPSVGCQPANNPGTWDEAKASEYIKEQLSLESVELTKTSDGFTGTGTDADGETFELVLTQQPDQNRLEYDATGSRGTMENGFYSTN